MPPFMKILGASMVIKTFIFLCDYSVLTKIDCDAYVGK